MLARASSSLKSIAAFAALLWGAAVVSASLTLAQVPAATDEHRLTLRAIMRELGEEYVRLSKALLSDDFGGLDESARAIQHHPLPAELVTAIKKKLKPSPDPWKWGFDAFERIDEQTHRAAADLATRAAAKDLSGSARAYARLALGCVACHKRFRAALRPLSDQ
jgi:cytochrome c556